MVERTWLEQEEPVQDSGQAGGGKKDEVTGRLPGNPPTLEKRCGQHQMRAKGSEI